MGIRIEGWKAIAAKLTTAAGVSISPDQAKRYAREHGLPVKRTGPGRQRVVAEPDKITDWCILNFG